MNIMEEVKRLERSEAGLLTKGTLTCTVIGKP